MFSSCLAVPRIQSLALLYYKEHILASSPSNFFRDPLETFSALVSQQLEYHQSCYAAIDAIQLGPVSHRIPFVRRKGKQRSDFG